MTNHKQTEKDLKFFALLLTLITILLLLLIFSTNIFFAQTNISSPEDMDETAIVLNDESQIFLDGAQNQTANAVSNSPSGIWIFVRMILVLILVVVIILS